LSQRSLRIAILGCRGIPAKYGGFETFAEQLAVRLAARGHEVTVYAEHYGRYGKPPADILGESWLQRSRRRQRWRLNKPPADTDYQGVRVRYRFRNPASLLGGGISTMAYDSACLWGARKGYDVVYMLGYGAAWACWLLRRKRVPMWINVDGLEWARSKWSAPARLYLRVMEWLSSRAATRVIADARAIKARFESVYPQGAPCSYIAYGADVVHEANAAHLYLWGLEPQRYLLVVARLEPENHVEEIIRGYLLHASSNPDAWPLMVVGAVANTAYQRKLVAFSSNRVRFLGGIYDAAQLQSLRLHAAAYLHGHSVGGTNPSLLEALACGNWVIAHDNPYNREVCGEGADACADYFSTSEELASHLGTWAAFENKQRDKCAKRARERIEQHYTWEAIADAYEALMRAECGP